MGRGPDAGGDRHGDHRRARRPRCGAARRPCSPTSSSALDARAADLRRPLAHDRDLRLDGRAARAGRAARSATAATSFIAVRDPRPDRGDLLPPLLARQVARDLRRAPRPSINYVGVPNPMLAADVVDEDGRSLRGPAGRAGRGRLPLPGRHRRLLPGRGGHRARPSATAGSTPATSASTTTTACGSWSTAPRTS